jgi:hypothetical protein
MLKQNTAIPMTRLFTLSLLLFMISGSGFAKPTPSKRQVPKAAKVSTVNIVTEQRFAVEVGTLSAVRFDDRVTISWDTQLETGNHGFEIERRSENHSTWTTVGFVPSRMKTEQSSYEFTDRSSFETVTYYRIKQISVNSNATYSGSMVVLPEAYTTGFSIVSAGGNASGKLLSITLPSEQSVTVRVIDVYGKEVGVLFQESTFSAGHHLLPFTAQQYPAGVYLLKLESSEGVMTAAMMK